MIMNKKLEQDLKFQKFRSQVITDSRRANTHSYKVDRITLKIDPKEMEHCKVKQCSIIRD